MGCAIAGELARRGCHVTMYDETDFTRTRAKHIVQASLLEHVQSGLLVDDAECRHIMSRVKVADTLATAVATVAIVFEAVIDDVSLKQELFREMVAAGTKAVLTTNTITLNVHELVKGTGLVVCGCRFLAPVWFIHAVEVTRPHDPQAADSLVATLSELGFQVSYYTRNSGLSRLSTQDAERWAREQREHVASERSQLERTARERESLGQEAPADGSDVAAAASTAPAVCSVCLDAQRDALLTPCGHMTTCVACAQRLRPPVCVACRKPIEQILRWRDL